MNSGRRRLVVTGVGALTPLGLDWASFLRALLDGRGGIRPLSRCDARTWPVRIGGEVLDFDARDFVERKDRKHLKVMVRTSELAVAAARRALDDAGDLSRVDPARFGVVFGSSIIAGDLADFGPAALACRDPDTGRVSLAHWGTEGIANLPPTWMLNHVPNMAACLVSILHDAQGPNNTVTQSEAAGLFALGEAARTLRGGRADLMLAGGADTRSLDINVLRSSLFAEVSRRNDDPARASRPFDACRDGQALSEGAGVVVIEGLDHARGRGARARAEVLGFASGFDAGCQGPGLARVVRQALRQAEVDPADLDHVNAHAPSTRREDAWEARALAEAAPGVPVVAFKSYLGNMGAGAGIAELAASLAAFETGVVPGTLNHERTADDCPVRVQAAARPLERPYVLKVSCTERGHCAAVVLRKWEEEGEG